MLILARQQLIGRKNCIRPYIGKSWNGARGPKRMGGTGPYQGGGARGAKAPRLGPKVSKMVHNLGHVLPKKSQLSPKNAYKRVNFRLKSPLSQKKHAKKSTFSHKNMQTSPLSPKKHHPPPIQTWLRA